jgi:nucleotide-binding universal stress UspA family protein
MEMSYPEIVVAGVDGSDASAAAAQWAAEDALRRAVPLRLVHVMTPSPEGGYLEPQLVASRVSDATRRWTRSLLHTTRSGLLADYPGLQVETASHVGSPLTVLLKESRRATVTVVGTAGGGRISDAVFGSVGAKLAALARGRVVFVPAVEETATEASPWAAADGPVVVGIDGSARTEPAIAFAFQEAAIRNSLLVAVHVGNGPAAHTVSAVDSSTVDGSTVAGSAGDGGDGERHRRLVELTTRWAAKYPTVPVRSVVLHGRPIRTLMRYLSDAPNGRPQLAVVGSRPHGSLATVLAGSTGLALVRQARCPVAVVQGEPIFDFVST